MLLGGRKILIVEDEVFLAYDIAYYVRNLGGVVLGPALSLRDAARFVERADAALLDIELGTQNVFPIADRLIDRGVPFVFFSAHGVDEIPHRLRHAPRLGKPSDTAGLFKGLSAVAEHLHPPPGGPAASVLSLLPKLRLAARLVVADDGAGDRLVERVLERAIRESRSLPGEADTDKWLTSLLEREAASSSHLLN